MVPTESKNWILIRGLARGVGHWGSFPEKLKQNFPNDNFYFVDIPGNGYLSEQATPLKVANFIDSFNAQLEKQNFDFLLPTFGLSLSLGSMAMVEWAKQRPKLFQKIILMNTSAANFSNIFHRLSFDAMALGYRLSQIKSLADREVESLEITTSLSKDQIKTDFKKELDLMVQFSEKYAAKSANVLRQLIAGSTYRFPKNPPTEVLILSGSKDKFVSAKCSNAIAKYWNCAHRIHPEAGHDISFQFPDWVIEQIVT